MGFVQVRIGYPREVDAEMIMSQFVNQFKPAGGRLANFKRHLGAHFSGRDLRQLFTKAIETEDINNRYGIPYLIVYGVSGNSRRFWSLESAANILDYKPDDDSETKYSDAIKKHLTNENRASRLGD